MARVIGIGGVFMKSTDPQALRAWYQKHLGCPVSEDEGPGIIFHFGGTDDTDKGGYAVWGPFKADTEYFNPSSREFMINLRVDDLDGLLAKLKSEGIEQVGGVEDYDYGRFAWILDPEGTKIELWEPA